MSVTVIVADHGSFDYSEIVRHSNLVVYTRNTTSGIDGAGEKVLNA